MLTGHCVSVLNYFRRKKYIYVNCLWSVPCVTLAFYLYLF